MDINTSSNQFQAPSPEASKKFPVWVIGLVSILLAGLIASGIYYLVFTRQASLVYSKYSHSSGVEGDRAEIVVSNFDGSSRSIVQAIPIGHSIRYHLDFYDMATDGVILYTATAGDTFADYEEELWINDRGGEPKKILSGRNKNKFSYPKISFDGAKLVYVSDAPDDLQADLWVMDANGQNKTLVINNLASHVAERDRQMGAFGLIPVSWSEDNRKVYLISSSDDEHTPVGLYSLDLATKRIAKIDMPEVKFGRSRIAFSPDRTKVAYASHTLQGANTKLGPFEILDSAVAGYEISVLDLNSGTVTKAIESQTDEYLNPIWSSDGTKIVYTGFDTTGPKYGYISNGPSGLFVVDVNSKQVNKIVAGRRNSWLRPGAWLSDNGLAYTESNYSTTMEGYAGSQITEDLITIRADGTDKQKIDSVTGDDSQITVFGSF